MGSAGTHVLQAGTRGELSATLGNVAEVSSSVPSSHADSKPPSSPGLGNPPFLNY